MHAVISLSLQRTHLLLTSSMRLCDVIMTSYFCQRHAECIVTTLFQQDTAPAHCTVHVQQLNCWVKKRQSFLRPTCCCCCWQLLLLLLLLLLLQMSWIIVLPSPMASKQFRSQSCRLRDLGCHAASCLPQTNPYSG